jgi:macrolide-specific efflux system membrane fusion protein
VIAGFAEADASKISVGQPATVTFDALSNVTVSGAVNAVSPTSTVVSNVVTYDVTISVTNPASTVKIGMTVQASVVVASASNVLEVPSSVITSLRGVPTVTLYQNGTQIPGHRVTLGLQGDTQTQITGGLSAGEMVVEPTATVSSSTGTGTGTGSGGGAGAGKSGKAAKNGLGGLGSGAGGVGGGLGGGSGGLGGGG